MKTTLENTPLSQEQARFYNENGFLSVPCLTDETELKIMRTAYDRIFAEKAGRDEGNEFDLAGGDVDNKQAALPQILNPAKYAPELRDTKAEAAAREIAQQLLCPDGSEKVVGGPAHAILKPAFHGAITPWHQDEAYWDPKMNPRSISIWMPLQEATLENGCMQFIPGSHKLEILPHQSIGKDPRVHGLEICEPNDIDFSKAVPCPIPAGGATLHPGRTLHYAGSNNSPEPRRALIFGFSLPPIPREDDRRFVWNEIKKTARSKRAETAKNTL